MNRKKRHQTDRLINLDTAKLVAREVAKPQRLTCEGCAFLRIKPAPMCKGEASPNFRQVRDTYHDRCASYTVSGVATPATPEPPPMSRGQIAGEVPRLKRKRVYVTGDVARRLA